MILYYSYLCFVYLIICCILWVFFFVFFFKQKTAYEMRISDWSSDVCSSDLRRRAIILGGAIMAMGHFLLTFQSLFYPGLALIVIGNGFFLPAIPAQIGDLYETDDPRYAGAFTIYYVGLNIVGLLAPFIFGQLGELYGWHWGFGAAGLGLVTWLLLYLFVG